LKKDFESEAKKFLVLLDEKEKGSNQRIGRLEAKTHELEQKLKHFQF